LECQRAPEQKTEFFNYLEGNNLPIALLNETHLHLTTKLKCPNYCPYRADREGWRTRRRHSHLNQKRNQALRNSSTQIATYGSYGHPPDY
jgi:hypothetical protein